MPMRTRGRSTSHVRAALAVGALAVAGLTSPLPAMAAGSAAADPARPFVSGTQTVAAYDYDIAIHERIEVEVPGDGDRNGVTDRAVVDLIRPREAEAAGVDVPVIIAASPYYEVLRTPGEYDENGVRRLFTTWLDNYFVPRGYAVAFVDLAGTHRSTGCDDVGALREIASGKAVIDWLNGRADAFDADGDLAPADWSTGKAAMIGTSWDGTIANSVASTGVEGLETIVPIAAISSWYDYTRSFGTPYFQDHMAYLQRFVSNFDSPYCRELTPKIDRRSEDETGDYSKWWNPRNYRLDASKITASVLVAHGLNDENVRTGQFGNWWEELEANDVERKIFLHQGDHLDGFSFREQWVSVVHPWFDYYLQDLPNGVPAAPMARIQREDGEFTSEDTWPVAGIEPRTFVLSGPTAAAGAGTFGVDEDVPAADRVTFTQSRPTSSDAVVEDPRDQRDDRAVFLSRALPSDVRLAGSSTISLRLKVDKPATAVQARVVDYGTATRFSYAAEVSPLKCWGQGDEIDTGCYPDVEIETQESDLSVITRTIADVGHYKSLRHKEVLEPGRWYRLTYELNTDDVVFTAGHNIGLVVTAELDNPLSTYDPVTITIDTTRSAITMPLAGEVDLTATGPQAPISGSRFAQPEPTHDLDEFMREFLSTAR